MAGDIFERSLAGEPISPDDPDYERLRKVMENTRHIISELNTSYHETDQIITLIRTLGAKVDSTVQIRLPFYTDLGMFIKLGRRVFVNQACVFMDRGGIMVEDDVKIGPRVNLITENYGLEPGSVVDIPAGTVHWHGASPDSRFTHVGISPKVTQNGYSEFGPVTDDEYKEATKE